MEREEKALEVAMEMFSNRAHDLKTSLNSFIGKLESEYEILNWPSVLDNFALVSGQVNTLLKILKNEKTPNLRNRVLLPLLLSPDRDEELAKLTENRVQAFSHEVVPDYLRTKPDPEVEGKDQLIINRANQLSMDVAQKQYTTMNKIVNNIVDLVKLNREDWESESGQRASATQTSSLADTTTLISAISLGKGLKPPAGSPKGQPHNPPPPQQQPTRPGNVGGKMPSSIKTNIKAATTMTPYSR